MENLDETLISIRPKIQSTIEPSITILVFQNECLRPILKMLNDKINIFAKHWMTSLKNINDLNQRRKYATDFFNKNPLKSHIILGMVIGMMTTEEHAYTLDNVNEVSKRIKDLAIERIISNV
jgi:hypothetical protein